MNYGMGVCMNLVIVLGVIIGGAEFGFEGWVIECVGGGRGV